MTFDKSFLSKPQYSFLKTNPLKSSLGYLVVGGSHSYGLATKNSDIDLRGFFLQEPKEFYGLYPPKDVYDNRNTDTTIYSYHRFIELLSKSNPNMLDLIGIDVDSDLILKKTDYAVDLLRNRQKFLSKQIFYTFGGYANQMLKQLQEAMKNHTESSLNYRARKKTPDKLSKHASCLIRLLFSAINIMKTGDIRTRLDEHLEILSDIRFGRMSMEDVFILREKLEKELQNAKDETKLPERPDYEWIDKYLKRMISLTHVIPM